MRSHLTRGVFRRLLSNEGIRCRCASRPLAVAQLRYGMPHLSRISQRRTFIGFIDKAAVEEKPVDIVPGLDLMLLLQRDEELHVRPPPTNDIVRAFKSFFDYKQRRNEAVNNTQALTVLKAFLHLQQVAAEPVYEEDEEDDLRELRARKSAGLSLEDLIAARDVMLRIPTDKAEAHSEFARELFAEINRRRAGSAANDEASHVDTRLYVTALALSGHAAEAKELTVKFCASDAADKRPNRRKSENKMWLVVLQGFAAEGNREELLQTAALATAAGMPYNQAFQETMTTFFARRDDVPATKQWFGERLADNSRPRLNRPTAQALSEMLQFCIRNEEHDWCSEIFKQLIDSNPDKEEWDVILQWAVEIMGQGVEEVEHMMEVMKRRHPNDSSMRPDSTTINGLVALAMAKHDMYLAERYMTLAHKLDIRPNSKTYILQMNYRIGANDMSGAQATYEALRSEEIHQGEDLPVVNRYLRALCGARTPNVRRIEEVAYDLKTREARLEPDTVSALAMMYLDVEEDYAVMETLLAHTYHHSLEERAKIEDTLLDYCLDMSKSDVQAWAAYKFLRQAFPEMNIGTRTRIMDGFFRRDRADMAMHTFGHMRQHKLPEERPQVETYVTCFEGIARCGDTKTLQTVHNMMKTDAFIEPTTALYNALMLAHMACGLFARAEEFWRQISNSRAGPTYSSLEIVFRLCELRDGGDRLAADIWERMKKMDIDIPPAVATGYAGVLAAQDRTADALRFLDTWRDEFGFAPDAAAIGTVWNLSGTAKERDDIEKWATNRYPQAWHDLTQMGTIEHAAGGVGYAINRDIKP